VKKFILSLAVVGLSVGILAAGPKSGGNGGGPKGNGPSGGFTPSHKPMHSGPSMGGSWKSPENWKSGYGHDFVHKYGKSFSHGFYFPGKGYNHWTYSCYSKKYGCSCYWCPYTSCYYYWCEPACCYYPISYITVAPPAPCVTCAAPVQVQTQTQVQYQSQTQVQGPTGIPTGGSPPPGVPALPE
jgi:hypothetical protein